MKSTTILLSIALAFKTVYSKAIDAMDSVIAEQLNVNDNSIEVVNNTNFIYKFHCEDDKDYCDKIKSDIEFAFNKLSNTFEFYQPVVFEAFVEDTILKYGFSFIAGVTDINYVALKSSSDNASEAPFLYPQALSKQLNFNKEEPDYKKNDFIMIINNWKSGPSEYRNNEYRDILIHELLHGLGFVSSGIIRKLDDNDVFNIDEGTENLLFNENDQYTIFREPIPSFDDQLMEITNIEEYMNQLYHTKLSKFIPFNIFDKYIVSLESGESMYNDLQFFYKTLNGNCLPKDGSDLLMKDLTNKYIKDCYENLHPNIQKIIESKINSFFNAHTLGIKTKDGEIIPLQTLSKQYQPGSSVSHIANPLVDALMQLTEGELDSNESLEEFIDFSTETVKEEAILKYYDDNFILYFSDEVDYTIEESMEYFPNNEKHPLIGDGIVKIMTTLGWTEKGEKRSNDIYHRIESIDIPESKEYQYKYRQRYEISNQDHTETESTTVYIPLEEPTPSDEYDIEVDVDDHLLQDQESDSDSDSEIIFKY